MQFALYDAWYTMHSTCVQYVVCVSGCVECDNT